MLNKTRVIIENNNSVVFDAIYYDDVTDFTSLIKKFVDSYGKEDLKMFVSSLMGATSRDIAHAASNIGIDEDAYDIGRAMWRSIEDYSNFCSYYPWFGPYFKLEQGTILDSLMAVFNSNPDKTIRVPMWRTPDSAKTYIINFDSWVLTINDTILGESVVSLKSSSFSVAIKNSTDLYNAYHCNYMVHALDTAIKSDTHVFASNSRLYLPIVTFIKSNYIDIGEVKIIIECSHNVDANTIAEFVDFQSKAYHNDDIVINTDYDNIVDICVDGNKVLPVVFLIDNPNT